MGIGVDAHLDELFEISLALEVLVERFEGQARILFRESAGV
jgi:hypothetical protein